MMKSEEASGVDGDTHATRRERNSKSGTLGDWGIQETRPWPTRAASHDLAGFWATRMSRFDSGPYRSSGFDSRLASSFCFPAHAGLNRPRAWCSVGSISIPRTRGAKENAARPPQKRSSGTQFGGLKNT
jgi:hypothetical protein